MSDRNNQICVLLKQYISSDVVEAYKEMFEEEMNEKIKKWNPKELLNILDTDLALWKEEQLTK